MVRDEQEERSLVKIDETTAVPERASALRPPCILPEKRCYIAYTVLNMLLVSPFAGIFADASSSLFPFLLALTIILVQYLYLLRYRRIYQRLLIYYLSAVAFIFFGSMSDLVADPAGELGSFLDLLGAMMRGIFFTMVGHVAAMIPLVVIAAINLLFARWLFPYRTVTGNGPECTERMVRFQALFHRFVGGITIFLLLVAGCSLLLQLLFAMGITP